MSRATLRRLLRALRRWLVAPAPARFDELQDLLRRLELARGSVL